MRPNLHAAVYEPRPFWKTSAFLYAVACVAIAAVAGGAAFAVLGAKNNNSSNGVAIPSSELPIDQVRHNKDDLGTVLVSLYNQKGIEWNGLADASSPQGKALTTIASRQVYGNDRVSNVQRFALATLYFSTNQVPNVFEGSPGKWSSEEGWLLAANECQWEGIVCDNAGRVTGILLPSHRLSGSLPLELAFLEQLTTMDLQSNYIYMEDDLHDVFLHMPQLQELVLDDNYIVSTTGVPAQFSALKSIQKISLSYNLLQGELDGTTFAPLTQLEHLELESNYISGGVPQTIAGNPILVYLYLRRNWLSFELNELIRPGNLPKIFALWLDSNDVSGTIPTEIGLLTDLASFSATNCTLSGPLPAELGDLQYMRRIWLYGNELVGPIPQTHDRWSDLQVFEVYDNLLTGKMPQAICDEIASSTYEFRTLSADCREVDCQCCSQCY